MTMYECPGDSHNNYDANKNGNDGSSNRGRDGALTRVILGSFDPHTPCVFRQGNHVVFSFKIPYPKTKRTHVKSQGHMLDDDSFPWFVK